jgi:hypothetical protein
MATTLQTPTEIRFTVAPDTAHTFGVADEKLTASPELAVALSAIGASPNIVSGRAENEMLCAAPALMLWVTLTLL